MTLSGLQKISVRPRGGLASVKFIPASAGVTTDAARSAAADLEEHFLDAQPYFFREDGANYTEALTAEGLVKHTLELDFPATSEARLAVDQLLAQSSGGIVASAVTASGETLLIGWSERFGAAYPLRVTAVASGSGSTPGDLPTINLTLSSVDADISMNI